MLIELDSVKTAAILLFSEIPQEFIEVSKRGRPKSSISHRQRTEIKFRCLCGSVVERRWDRLKKQADPVCLQCVDAYRRPRGPDHPQWNPNITDEERLTRNRGNEFPSWSNAVLRRDGWRCVISGTRSSTIYPICAHHLYNWGDYPDKRLDVRNGVTILRSLHVQFHKIYGARFNTPEQFSEFMELYLI